MSRLTTDNIKGMIDLAYNQFFVKDHLAIHRDFEREIDCRDLAREIVKNLKIEYVSEEFFTDDDFFDDEIMEWLQFGTNDVMGVIAMYYMAMWGMATVRDSLKEYEDTNLTPSQLKEIDTLYLEKCQEVNKLNAEMFGWQKQLVTSKKDFLEYKANSLNDEEMCQLCKALSHFKKLDEQGRLIELPFKVKDTVYLVDFSAEKIDEAEILNISIYEHGNEYVSDLLTFYEEDINVVVFLTKAEAEKALAESEVSE